MVTMIASSVNAEAIGPLCSLANPCADTTKCCAAHLDTLSSTKLITSTCQSIPKAADGSDAVFSTTATLWGGSASASYQCLPGL